MNLNKFNYLIIVLIFNYITIPLAAISEQDISQNIVNNISKYEIDFSKIAKKIMVPQGTGSSLVFKEQKNNKLYFYTLTDRGPNFEGPDTIAGEETIIFSSPEFKPYIGLVEVSPSNNTAEVVSTTTLFDSNNKEINGIFKFKTKYNNKIFIPINKNGEAIKQPREGIDSESLAVAEDGSFWIGEEYSLSLLHFSKEGKLIKKYSPGKGLPEILSKCSLNRGIEAMAITPSGKIIFIMESILDLGQDREITNFVRVVSFDPKSETIKMFLYPFDNDFYKAKSLKIGDMKALGEELFILIEQGYTKTGEMQNKLFIMDLKEATNISDLEPEVFNNLEFTNYQKLPEIKTTHKELLLDLRKCGWNFEKAEGIAVIAPNKIAISNDNDFGIKGGIANSNKKLNLADHYLDIANNKIYHHDGSEVKEAKFVVERTKEKSYIWIIELNKPFM